MKPFMTLALSFVVVAGLIGIGAQDAANRQTFGYIYVRQQCRAEDGRNYGFAFVSNLFSVPPEKSSGAIANSARRAFDAMVAAESWSCANIGGGLSYINGSSKLDAEFRRAGTVRYEQNGGIGVVEFDYYDGASAGSSPRQTSDPR